MHNRGQLEEILLFSFLLFLVLYQISKIFNNEDELGLAVEKVSLRSNLEVLLRANYLVANIIRTLFSRVELLMSELL